MAGKSKTKAAPAKKYLERVMFTKDEVEGKQFSTDNMEYMHPICVNDLEDGEVLAVYEFIGLKKVTKTVTLTDAK